MNSPTQTKRWASTGFFFQTIGQAAWGEVSGFSPNRFQRLGVKFPSIPWKKKGGAGTVGVPKYKSPNAPRPGQDQERLKSWFNQTRHGQNLLVSSRPVGSSVCRRVNLVPYAVRTDTTTTPQARQYVPSSGRLHVSLRLCTVDVQASLTAATNDDSWGCRRAGMLQ